MITTRSGGNVVLKRRHSNVLESIRDMHFFFGAASRPLSVSYSSLNKLSDGERISVGSGIYTEFRKTATGLMFITTMSKGSRLDDHYHPDCVEMIYVAKGSVTENHTKVIYREGESFFIAPGVVHNLISNEHTRLNVQFVKQPDKK